MFAGCVSLSKVLNLINSRCFRFVLGVTKQASAEALNTPKKKVLASSSWLRWNAEARPKGVLEKVETKEDRRDVYDYMYRGQG